MNKKLLALTTALTVAVSGAAFAKCDYEDCMKMMHRDMGGFVQSQADISTVKQAMEMPDDAIVTLKGNIEKQVKKDKYIFKDATGEMTIEIGKKVWAGQTVSPSDTVVITGEIDKDFEHRKLDVERLTKE